MSTIMMRLYLAVSPEHPVDELYYDIYIKKRYCRKLTVRVVDFLEKSTNSIYKYETDIVIQTAH